MLNMQCPSCQDEAIRQVEMNDELEWIADGWIDPLTGLPVPISFCPFCGENLDEVER